MTNLPFLTSCAGAALLLSAMAGLIGCQGERDEPGAAGTVGPAPGAPGSAVDQRRPVVRDGMQAHPDPSRNQTRAGTWNEQAVTGPEAGSARGSAPDGTVAMAHPAPAGDLSSPSGSANPTQAKGAADAGGVAPGSRPGADGTSPTRDDAASRLRKSLQDEPSLSAHAKAVEASMRNGRLVVRGHVATAREREWILDRARSYAGAGMVDDELKTAVR